MASIPAAWQQAGGSWDSPAAPAFRTVLPPNSTYQEREIEAASWRLNDPPDVSEVIDPNRAPAALLPWLAWAFSVDGWRSNGNERIKRSLIARSAADHRIKGTVEWFRRLTNTYGATLVGVERPPNEFFASTSDTDAQRRAVLDTLSQLRIRPYPVSAFYPLSLFCNAGYLAESFDDSESISSWDESLNFWEGKKGIGGSWAGAGEGAFFLTPSDAADRILPRAFYFDGESETALSLESYGDQRETIVRITRPGTHPSATFAGQFLSFLALDDAAGRVYTIELSPIYDPSNAVAYQTVSPSAVPEVVFPEFVRQTVSVVGMFCGLFCGAFLAPSTADQDVYWAVYLPDEPAVPVITSRSSYLGTVRLGQPAYTAELQVLWPVTAPPHTFFASGYLGYLSAIDQTELDNFIGDVSGSQPVRDQVYIDLNLFEIAVANPTRAAGDLIAGEMVMKVAA